MNAVLLIDFGSTYTKVTAVDTESETVLGIAEDCPREEVAAMLYKFIQKQGGGFTGASMFLWNPDDRAEISEDCVEACRFMSMHKIMQGQSATTFNPKADITRAEVCQILYNYLVVYKAA